MAGDLERALTKRVWTDDAFAAQVERDPVEAFKSSGFLIPDDTQKWVLREMRLASQKNTVRGIWKK
jgi:hypothetical protein